jgi:hypothetical protein
MTVLSMVCVRKSWLKNEDRLEAICSSLGLGIAIAVDNVSVYNSSYLVANAIN